MDAFFESTLLDFTVFDWKAKFEITQNHLLGLGRNEKRVTQF